METQDLNAKLKIPENVEATIQDRSITVKGPKGETNRQFWTKKLSIEKKGDEIIFHTKRLTKREKKLCFTYIAHIKNMFKGVTESHVYKLKICAGHFPMNVSVSGDEIVIKNFLGEKIPRKLKIKPSVKVSVQGTEVKVEGVDKELVGQQSASIEQLCRISNKDRRIFQDGIFIVNKDGKEIS